MVNSKIFKLWGLGRILATVTTVMLSSAVIFPEIALAAANVTFSTDTTVIVPTPNITLTAQAGSVADTFTVNASTIDLVIDAGNSVTLIDPAKGQINNNGGVSNCHLVSDQNVVTFTGPITVTVTPSTITCVSDSNNVGGSAFIPVTPTGLNTLGSVPSALIFTINGGAKTTINQKVILNLNADPATVRGYAVSLDSNFVNASIMPYNTSTPAVITLPNKAGIYTLFLKYYSTTGVSSNIFTQTITYTPGASPTSVSTIAATPPISFSFKRTLKLGSKGSDVKVLQQFLNSHGFIVAIKGAGSLGKETTTFGPATAKALIKFQEANALQILKPYKLKKGTGIFGVTTQNYVNNLLRTEAEK